MNAARKYLELIGITTEFDAIKALDDVSVTVAKGEVVCIIGPSGCGKSTLLRTINWLSPPQSGTVRLEGQVVGTTDGVQNVAVQMRALNGFRARMGMVFQQFNTWPHLTVRENVIRSQIVVLKRTRAEAEPKALQALVNVGLEDKSDDWPDTLSGGQKQRLAIARALAMDPDLMLLDEPTSALDPELVAGVLAILKALATNGMTMLIVTHELSFAAQAADRILFMEAGRIIEDGPPEQVLKCPKTQRLKGFLEKLAVTQLSSIKAEEMVLNDPI